VYQHCLTSALRATAKSRRALCRALEEGKIEKECFLDTYTYSNLNALNFFLGDIYFQK
jgi:hypothetical protein